MTNYFSDRNLSLNINSSQILLNYWKLKHFFLNKNENDKIPFKHFFRWKPATSLNSITQIFTNRRRRNVHFKGHYPSQHLLAQS